MTKAKKATAAVRDEEKKKLFALLKQTDEHIQDLQSRLALARTAKAQYHLQLAAMAPKLK